ncbi:MAG: isoprenylcysteine carboxylmethyltransferase family protein [Devosia sp.]|uniref:methyltransferase family protein n=1 Tax=Devosia sp. TaxID=1871048 RepID=UPI001A5A26F3|nr:isoprenylcysteine carboxylmethyltransferase family protein [Devosia sp.]MBL8596500.1 isoprenylcysteine carboxylmethyltransferase family protein [Devosia sp.]
MQLGLDILLTGLSIFVIGSHAVVGKGHFKSRQMPAGANLVSAAVLTTLAVFLLLLWSGEAPLAAQLVALALEAASLWLFFRTIAASRDGALHFAFDTENPVSLVTAGPYRHVRHPFYTSYLIFWTGLAIGTWSPWAIPVLVLMTVLYTVAARGEEAKFARTGMSEDYAAYRARTGMFWPKLG